MNSNHPFEHRQGKRIKISQGLTEVSQTIKTHEADDKAAYKSVKS